MFGNLDAAAPDSAPLTSGLSAARTVYRLGRKYEIFAAVHGLASANPIGACERHCEKIDAGELAPPKLRALRPRNLDLGMKKDETETSLSNQGSQIRALPWAARPIQVS